MKVQLHPDIEHDLLDLGSEVALNESFNVIEARRPETTGEVVSLKEVMEDGVRAVVIGRADEERVCELASALRGMRLRAGDVLRLDPRSNMLLEKLPRPEVEDLLLEEVPDVSYADIGGLDNQIEEIADAVELPFRIRTSTDCRPQGDPPMAPPGCGKTLTPRPWRSLPRRSPTRSARARTFVLHQHRGAEQVVGETERQIRCSSVLAKSEEGWPVIVFFDDGLDVPHPWFGHQLRHGPRSSRSCWPRSTGVRGCAT
jgi:proteasome-associated ATPase